DRRRPSALSSWRRTTRFTPLPTDFPAFNRNAMPPLRGLGFDPSSFPGRRGPPPLVALAPLGGAPLPVLDEPFGPVRALPAPPPEVIAFRVVVGDEEVLDLAQALVTQFVERADLRPVVRRLDGADQPVVTDRAAVRLGLLGLEDADEADQHHAAHGE